MLRVDGRVEDSIVVTVEPDSWSAVTFRVRRSDLGDYEVVLGRAATRFTVIGTG